MAYENFNNDELTRLYHHLHRIQSIYGQLKTEMGSLIKDMVIIPSDINEQILNIENELKNRKILIDDKKVYSVQKSIMKYLQRYWNRNNRSPSIKDIQLNVLNLNNEPISSTSVVAYHLSRLEKMGYIKINRKTQRGIEIIKKI